MAENHPTAEAHRDEDWLKGPRPAEWWTGLNPESPDLPGLDADQKLHALPQVQLHEIQRQSLLNYFDNGWLLTEVLFSALQGEEAFTRAPAHQLRHPLIFYYAHPAVLYVNKLRVSGLLQEPVDAYFENLFEVGVDEMSWDDMSKNEMKWPAVREVTEYRRKVYHLVRELISSHPELDVERKTIHQGTPGWGLVMGFEHERIHLETSSVLIRELPLRYLRQPELWPRLAPTNRQSAPQIAEDHVLVPAGQVKIGKPSDYPSFGWDNEYGTREVHVPEFRAGKSLVTNAQFLEFMTEGGYRDARFWSQEGWAWRSFRNTKAPTFWVPAGPGGLHDYKLRTLFSLIELPQDWPVIVNFHEAKAFCTWMTLRNHDKGAYRLLTEAEHHRLRPAKANSASWNLNLKFGSESSVHQDQSGDLQDVFGNVWQWCEDEFHPLPGFSAHPIYEDFSSPCFDGKHQMILGGSFASTGDEAEPFARFHFRPHFFQHAGFRWVRTPADQPAPAVRISKKISAGGSDYESTELLSQYLLLHFGRDKDVFPYDDSAKAALNFPARCAQMAIAAAHEFKIPLDSALDIGCAVGGATFGLSEQFTRVVGVDLSQSFVGTANLLKAGETLDVLRRDQGEITTRLQVRLPATANPQRVHFVQGDACRLAPELHSFNFVLMANLLCRLPDPAACLRAMGGARGVVAEGGLLLLLSPYSWLEQHTPYDSWLGGQQTTSGEKRSPQVIAKILGAEFQLLRQTDVPLLIREHERKYQYIVAHALLWQRKTRQQ